MKRWRPTTITTTEGERMYCADRPIVTMMFRYGFGAGLIAGATLALIGARIL